MTSTTSDRCLYEILELPRTASEDDILDAFDELAMRCHPDRNPGDDQALARYKAIAAAYEVLSNPQKRREYDAAHPADARQTETSANRPTTDSQRPRRRVSAGASFSDLFGSEPALPRKKSRGDKPPETANRQDAPQRPRVSVADDSAAEMADREALDLENWSTELRAWEHRLAERARELEQREAQLRREEQRLLADGHPQALKMPAPSAAHAPAGGAIGSPQSAADVQQLAAALAAVISSEVARATGRRDAA